MMGTSGSTKGSQSGTPLVPTWLDEPQIVPLPGSNGTEHHSADGNGDVAPQEPNVATRPAIPPPSEPERFRSARGSFSRFVTSGGSNQGALHRAVRDYIRSGTGGSHNAVKRMASSRAAASNALGVFRGIQHGGIQDTLRRLNLQNLIGRSAQEVFLGLTEVVCDDGGPIDEAIGRDAWLETVAMVDQFGINDLETLTVDQIRDFFLSFVAHAIEVRLYQEIGVNGFRFAENMNYIENFDTVFRSYIERAVRDSFNSNLRTLSTMSDQEIRTIVDKTYEDAFELLEMLGEQEE